MENNPNQGFRQGAGQKQWLKSLEWTTPQQPQAQAMPQMQPQPQARPQMQLQVQARPQVNSQPSVRPQPQVAQVPVQARPQNAVQGQVNSAPQYQSGMGVTAPQAAPVAPQRQNGKKKVVFWSVFGGLGVAAVAVIAVVAMMFLQADYSSAYLKAREVAEKIKVLAGNDACRSVVDFVGANHPTEEEYKKYATKCKNVADGMWKLVDELGATESVQKNGEIKAQFEKFESELATVIPDEEAEEFNEKLNLYRAWHDFELRVAVLNYNNSEEKFREAILPLAESGNETFEKYGEEWLGKTLFVREAYIAYEMSDASAADFVELRDAYERKSKSRDEWIAKNKPNITEMAPLNFAETGVMMGEWQKLYGLIADTYEKHYNFGSGDCIESAGGVLCD